MGEAAVSTWVLVTPSTGVLCNVVTYELQLPGRVAGLSDTPGLFLGTRN